MIKAGIIGASGYAGSEVLRFLLNHPDVEVVGVSAHSDANKTVSELYPSFYQICDVPFVEDEDEVIQKSDVIFAGLPAGISEAFAQKALDQNKKFIDLGADFRLKDEEIYKEWYNVSFIDKKLHEEAAYGLCEHYKDEIKNARIVANPGCYVTSISLPLMPLLKSKLIKKDGIVADSKSGVTGAGRGLTLLSHYPEINENMAPYKIGNHRHTPEIEQNLTDAAGEPVEIVFTPILSPMNRGILSTIYCEKAEGVTVEKIQNELADFYKDKPFVDVLPLGQVATVKHVRLSNKCAISVHENK